MADRLQHRHPIKPTAELSKADSLGNASDKFRSPPDDQRATVGGESLPSDGPQRLSIADVHYRYPQHAALNGATWDVPGGTIGCLMGASGCGKSTLLRLIGGYLPMQRGTISLGSQSLNVLSAGQREFGVVFQSPELFPHLTAFENVAFPLRVRKWKQAAITKRVHECFDWVGFPQPLGRRLPSQLSGGEQQRVSLARGISFSPSVLLLDEPFSQLDRELRDELQIRMRDLQAHQSLTVVWVTHDRDDLFAVADHAAVMSAGKIIAAGTPAEFYNGTAGFAALRVACGTALNQFRVAACNGSTVVLKMARSTPAADLAAGSPVANGLPVAAVPEVAAAQLAINLANIPAALRSRVRVGHLAGLRPEEIHLKLSTLHSPAVRPADNNRSSHAGVVRSCRSLGRCRELLVSLKNGLPLTVHLSSSIAIAVNDPVEVEIPVERLIWDHADYASKTP